MVHREMVDALVVMEDLGSAPSLADLLLGDDAPAARDPVLTWAAATEPWDVAPLPLYPAWRVTAPTDGGPA